MTLQLGRLSLPDDVVDVGSARSGDRLRVDCRAWVTPHHPLRRQLLGMADTDVAVSWSHDRTWAGWYRCGQPTVDVHHLDEDKQVLDFSVDLEPLASGRVDFEAVLTGATLPNVHGLAGGAPWLATPAGVDDLRSTPPATRRTRQSVDGPVRVWVGAPRHAVWSPLPDPAAWYDAAAEVRQGLSVVTGAMLDDPPGVLEVGNGLVRARFVVGAATWGDLTGTWADFGDLTWGDLGGVAGVQVGVWTGSVWVNKVWDLGVTPHACAVLRNTPHVCTVRLTEPLAPGGRTLDLTVRRGAMVVAGHVRGPAETRTVMRADAEPAVAITGGVAAASPDSDGVRYVAATVHAHTPNLPQGGFTRAAADRLTFMVGGSVTAASGHSPGDLVDQWVSYTDEAVRAVPR